MTCFLGCWPSQAVATSSILCVCVYVERGGGKSPLDDTPPADLSGYYLQFNISYFFACSALKCNMTMLLQTNRQLFACL